MKICINNCLVVCGKELFLFTKEGKFNFCSGMVIANMKKENIDLVFNYYLCFEISKL